MFWKKLPSRGRYIACWAVAYPLVVWWLMYGGFGTRSRGNAPVGQVNADVDHRLCGYRWRFASGHIAGARASLKNAGRAGIVSDFYRVLAWRTADHCTVHVLGHAAAVYGEGTSIDKLIRALVGVILFQSAYVAEVVRGGLQALPKGNTKLPSHWRWDTGKHKGW
jgi:general L-amino acid transport system permease protein